MAMAENVKAKAEELRTKIRSRIEEIRGGAASSEHSPILGKLELAKGPLVTELKEKGILATAKARFEKVRGAGGILGGGILGHSSPGIGEKVAIEKDAGALKQYRKALAIEA